MNRHEKPDRPAKERDPGRNREIMPEEGQKIMCQIFEDLAEKRAQERAMEEKKATARRMITRGKPTVEEIAENVDLPIDIVRDLAGLQLSK